MSALLVVTGVLVFFTLIALIDELLEHPRVWDAVVLAAILVDAVACRARDWRTSRRVVHRIDRYPSTRTPW